MPERLTRWWDRFGGEWSWERPRLRFDASFRTWPINLPRPRYWRDGDGEGRTLHIVSLAWGNGNSDPVWSLDLTIVGRKWPT